MIDTQAIRTKILDLAMRGKLTEQLPEDGTAEDLFQQIQEEKEELAKNGELYREKLISTISPCDIPYSIPKSWIWVRLGELSKVITKGSSPKWQGISYTDADNGILFVTSENIGKGKMIFDKKKYIQKQFNDNHQSSILQKGDILTNIVGASIGRTALFDLDTENANINQAVCIIRLVNAAISEYVLQYLCSERAVNLMLGKVVDTARANLSLTSVSNLLLPLPPLAEQKRIVEKIEQIFSILDAIDALQAKYAGNLSALKAKLIDAAIQGKLTEQLPEDGTAEELFQQIQEEKQALIRAGKIKKEKALPEITEDEIPFEIPSNWKWTHLGDLFQHNTGKALNSSDSEGIPLEYITTSNLYWDGFQLNNLKTMLFTESEIVKCTVTKGDLLVCEGGDIGRSAIWTYDYDMRIQNHIHRLRRFSTKICTEFYYYLLRLYKQTGRINGIGIGLQGFSSKRVHSLIVPFPPLAEQKRIVNQLNELFAAMG